MELEFIDFDAGDAERKGPKAAKEINTDISILSAEADGGNLDLRFDYTVVFMPDGGHIRIRGSARFKDKGASRAQAEWSKTGSISGKSGEFILNAIHYHASVNAVLLSKAFNLTPPIVLPTLKIGAGKASKRSKPAKR
jgi:hypothetical protein